MTAEAVLVAQECGQSRCVCHASRKRGSGLTHCIVPAHHDGDPSMNVTPKGGAILLRCHGGCDQRIVWKAAMAAGVVEHGDARWEDRIEAVYPYHDENGNVLFEVVRLHSPKDFRQRMPDGKWGIGETRRVLFRLQRVIAAVAEGKEVWIVEGEKDALALERRGIVATCSPGGAGKWREEYAAVLEGARVVIVRDKDGPGAEHSTQVWRSCKAVGVKAMRVVEAAEGKDAFDHLAAGHGLGEFRVVYQMRVPQAERAAWGSFALPDFRESDEQKIVQFHEVTAFICSWCKVREAVCYSPDAEPYCKFCADFMEFMPAEVFA